MNNPNKTDDIIWQIIEMTEMISEDIQEVISRLPDMSACEIMTYTVGNLTNLREVLLLEHEERYDAAQETAKAWGLSNIPRSYLLH